MTLAKGLSAFSVLWLVLGSTLVIAVTHLPPQASAFESAGQFSSTVIGQKDFISSTRATTENQLNVPFGIAFDSSGDLWVTEEVSNRVLEFRPPFTDGMSASTVLGQPNFTSSAPATSQSRMSFPTDLAFDASGNLWVSDRGNNRILEFRPPFSDGMNAVLELGQPAGNQEFNSSLPVLHAPNRFIEPRLANGLNVPVSLIFDSSGNLWVSDRLDNRVVEFEPPFSDGMNASLVIGQTSVDSFARNISATQSSLWGPQGIAFDPRGNLWVSDEEHNRVLEFSASSLKDNHPNATLEIGQPAGEYQFYNNTAADTASTFLGPFAIAFDRSGNLWVSDHRNNRVLGFTAPFIDGESASIEIGQPKGITAFTSSVPATNQTGFENPLGIAFDPSGDLWVVDQHNNRVLRFDSVAIETAGTTINIQNATETIATSPNARGVSCLSAGSQILCRVVSDQASLTNVKVELIGNPSGSLANIYSARFGSKEPSYAKSTALPLAMNTASSSLLFYGVVVSGIKNGTATICIDPKDSQVAGSSPEMAYFSNGAWASPASVLKTGQSTICGNIPLRAQSSGEMIIAVAGEGEKAGPASSHMNSSLVVTESLLVGGLSLVVILLVMTARRRKGTPFVQDEEDEEGGGWF